MSIEFDIREPAIPLSKERTAQAGSPHNRVIQGLSEIPMPIKKLNKKQSPMEGRGCLLPKGSFYSACGVDYLTINYFCSRERERGRRERGRGRGKGGGEGGGGTKKSQCPHWDGIQAPVYFKAPW